MKNKTGISAVVSAKLYDNVKLFIKEYNERHPEEIISFTRMIYNGVNQQMTHLLKQEKDNEMSI